MTRCRDNFPTNYNDSVNTYLSVINVPDSSGIGCEFALNSLYLNGGRTYLGLPNMPNYNLGRLIGSPCDTLQTVSLEENKNENLINIFPNPSSGIFEITFSEKSIHQTAAADISVYSSDGLLINQYKNSSINSKLKIDLSNAASGIYFIEVNFANDKIPFHKKIIINK